MTVLTRNRRIPLVEPALGWVYLSRAALARAKAQMDEESMGVRDEVGFLAIHQGYADRFFPGTSVLHTRARYALFVPWLFKDIAGLTGAAATRSLRERERLLAGRLKEAGESQVIGGRIYPDPSSQPPFVVYWNALAVWGILRPRQNGRTLSRSEAHRMLKNIDNATDDDGQPLIGFEPPFIRLPDPPSEWRNGEITLRLAKDEAAFLWERLSRLRPANFEHLSLLARLVKTKAAAPSNMWSEEVAAVAGPEKDPLARAQEASKLAGVGRAVYDALLECISEAQDKRQVPTRHRDHLGAVIDEHGSAASKLDVDALEQDIGSLPPRLRNVLVETRRWLTSASKQPMELYQVYAASEARKGTRARLPLTPDGRARRLEWSSDQHVLAAPLHYRWEQVGILLNDLAEAE